MFVSRILFSVSEVVQECSHDFGEYAADNLQALAELSLNSWASICACMDEDRLEVIGDGPSQAKSGKDEASVAGLEIFIPPLLMPAQHSVMPVLMCGADIEDSLNTLLFTATGDALLICFFVYVVWHFEKARTKATAEAALQAALRDQCSHPIQHKIMVERKKIYMEQSCSELANLFHNAQADRPMSERVVRHCDLREIRKTAAALSPGARAARVTWSTETPTDDYLAYVTLHEGKQAVGLSYADACEPGGQFAQGRGAQESSLCCGAFYYPSLKKAHESFGPLEEPLYRFGFPEVRSLNGQLQVRRINKTRDRRADHESEWHVWNPEEEFTEYATVLVSQNVRRYRVLDRENWLLLHPQDQHFVTYVAAAAPHWSAHSGNVVLTNASEEECDILKNIF